MYKKVVTWNNVEVWFEWDERKAASNLAKHHIGFEAALRVFADPLAQTEMERIEHGEQRWQTLGLVDGRLLLLVVHTSRILEEDRTIEVVRIISARNPNRRERLRFERETG